MGVISEPYRGNDFFKSFTKTWHIKPYPQISPERPELSAAGKIVFITGGGTGIGKATAIAFAQAGAKGIAIFGRRIERLRSAADEIRKANPAGTTQVVFESVDLSKRAAVDAGFASALEQLGVKGKGIDVLVSNAGMMPKIGPVTGYDEAEFQKGLEMNSGSSFNTVQAMMPLLAADATVLNISSGIAHIEPVPQIWLYAATKLANAKMFDYLQSEHPNLRIINVQPGVVTSELNMESGFPGQDDGKFNPSTPLFVREKKYSIGLTLNPSPLVELPGQFHLWLASPEAAFLKGKFVWVNWDVDELKARADEVKDSLLLRVVLNGVPMTMLGE